LDRLVVWRQRGCGGGRDTRGGGYNNGRIGGKFSGKGFFEQVGEPDVTCHYCKEKDHTKFTCWKLTGKPTQPTRATNVTSIQDDSSLI